MMKLMILVKRALIGVFQDLGCIFYRKLSDIRNKRSFTGLFDYDVGFCPISDKAFE